MTGMNCQFDTHAIEIENTDGFRPRWVSKALWAQTQFAYTTQELLQYGGSSQNYMTLPVVIADSSDANVITRFNALLGLIGVAPLQRTLANYFGESWTDVTLMNITNVTMTVGQIPSILKCQLELSRPNP